MIIPVTPGLNQGQSAAAESFFEFLFKDDQKELIISGPGGVGKSFLMCALIDQIMPRYYENCALMGLEPKYTEVAMTATTNKAAEILAVGTSRPTSTIHSLLNLIVKNDFETGTSKLTKGREWKVHENMIVFIDECSMIDTPLRNAIREGFHNCKIVYVGDHCQLAPVMEPIAPIYRDNLPFFELTEQMRTGNPVLQAVNQQLRDTVETGQFHPIQLVPGSIDWMDDETMEATMAEAFAEQTHETRILAYTNARVNLFNDHIRREVRGLPAEYIPGEYLINNSAIRVGKTMLSVEAEVEIIQQSPPRQKEIAKDVFLEVAMSTLKLRSGAWLENVPVPVDRDHFTALVEYYRKAKKWQHYFALKETYPDLRPRDTCTVHKAQGSTHDSVFIDLSNISSCHQPDQVARMLYVAFSRAKTRVFLYGELAPKYGGLVH